jgi:hypothetical protein
MYRQLILIGTHHLDKHTYMITKSSKYVDVSFKINLFKLQQKIIIDLLAFINIFFGFY